MSDSNPLIQDENVSPSKVNFASSGDVHSHYLVMNIDRGIKNKKKMINTEKARWHYNLYRKLKPVMVISLIFLVLITFFERPAWCIDNPEITYAWNCDTNSNFKLGRFASSNIPKLPPIVTHVIEIILLLILLAFTLWKNTFKTHSKTTLIFERI